MIKEAIHNIKKSPNVTVSGKLHFCLDGAYDSNENFDQCDENDTIAVIAMRKNFSGNANGSTTRKKHGFIQFGNCKVNRKNERMFNRLTKKQKLENQKQ